MSLLILPSSMEESEDRSAWSIECILPLVCSLICRQTGSVIFPFHQPFCNKWGKRKSFFRTNVSLNQSSPGQKEIWAEQQNSLAKDRWVGKRRRNKEFTDLNLLRSLFHWFKINLMMRTKKRCCLPFVSCLACFVQKNDFSFQIFVLKADWFNLRVTIWLVENGSSRDAAFWLVEGDLLSVFFLSLCSVTQLFWSRKWFCCVGFVRNALGISYTCGWIVLLQNISIILSQD